MGIGNYALLKLSDTQMLQYFIPLHRICHEVHNFTNNKLLAVFYIGETLQRKFSVKIFNSKCDQIVDLVKFTEKCSMENFIFDAVKLNYFS